MEDETGAKKLIAVGIVGPGLIGKTLLSQLADQVHVSCSSARRHAYPSSR
jgi:homoserine dehydrogenase